VVWLWLFTTFIKEISKAINKTILTVSTLSWQDRHHWWRWNRTHLCHTVLCEHYQLGRTNLDGSSHSFSQSYLPQSTRNPARKWSCSLSKTQLNHNSGSYWIGYTTVSPAATSLTLSLACFAQRNSLAVTCHSGCHCHWCTSIKVIHSHYQLEWRISMLVGTVYHSISLFLYPLHSGKFSRLLRTGWHRFLCHLEPLRQCRFSYPQTVGSTHPHHPRDSKSHRNLVDLLLI